MSNQEQLEALFRQIHNSPSSIQLSKKISLHPSQPQIKLSESSSRKSVRCTNQQAQIKKIQGQQCKLYEQSQKQSESSLSLTKYTLNPLKSIKSETSRAQLLKMGLILFETNKNLRNKLIKHLKDEIQEIPAHQQLNIQQILQSAEVLSENEKTAQKLIKQAKLQKQYQDNQIKLAQKNIALLHQKINSFKIDISKKNQEKSNMIKQITFLNRQFQEAQTQLIQLQRQKIQLLEIHRNKSDFSSSQNKVEKLLSEYLDTLDKTMKYQVHQSRVFKKSMQFLDPNYDVSKMWAVNSVAKSDESDSYTNSPLPDLQLDDFKKKEKKTNKIKTSAYYPKTGNLPPPVKKLQRSQEELESELRDKQKQTSIFLKTNQSIFDDSKLSRRKKKLKFESSDGFHQSGQKRKGSRKKKSLF